LLSGIFTARPEFRLVGCGGHARSLADVILANEPRASILFIDPNARPGETILGFPAVREAGPGGLYIVAIGDNSKRKSVFEDLASRGTSFATIVSKGARRGLLSEIGEGSFVAHGAHIGPEARIGRDTIINSNAVIEHEVRVGDHCHIAPNATISGRTVVGDLVFVGAGATIVDGVRVASGCTIGAGAVVVKDIGEAGVYVGCPARKR
jgi:UDP-N-acetylbacillosamine N-acetyltransferase